MSYKLLLAIVLLAIISVTEVVSAVTLFDVETVTYRATAHKEIYHPVQVGSVESEDSVAPAVTYEEPAISSDSEVVAADEESKTADDPVLEVAAVKPQSMTAAAVENTKDESGTVFTVPFFSQFSDISSVSWRKVGCGIASLAMLIEYYEPAAVSVDDLLNEGIAEGAYLTDAGWSHAGLINLSRKFGLTGESHSLAESSMAAAFAELETVLASGPVMASVHYTFDPNNPIPHLVVVNGVADGKVYYNDPAEPAGGGSVSIAKFQSAWKKRYIEIRPV